MNRNFKRCIVTGATGSGGSFLVEHLINKDKKIKIYCFYISNGYLNLLKNKYKKNIYFIKIDLKNFNKLKKIVKNINPDLIVFLGDSNTSGVAFPLKKEGYKICHIEAGMRSFDKRMLEEINRTVCDHCSDILFVYHDEYKRFLENENIKENVKVSL